MKYNRSIMQDNFSIVGKNNLQFLALSRPDFHCQFGHSICWVCQCIDGKTMMGQSKS